MYVNITTYYIRVYVYICVYTCMFFKNKKVIHLNSDSLKAGWLQRVHHYYIVHHPLSVSIPHRKQTCDNMWLSCSGETSSIYPLVLWHMERSTIFNGKTHIISTAMFHGKLLVPEGRPSWIRAIQCFEGAMDSERTELEYPNHRIIGSLDPL